MVCRLAFFYFTTFCVVKTSWSELFKLHLSLVLDLFTSTPLKISFEIPSLEDVLVFMLISDFQEKKTKKKKNLNVISDFSFKLAYNIPDDLKKTKNYYSECITV